MSTNEEKLITLEVEMEEEQSKETNSLDVVSRLTTKQQRFVYLYMTGQYTVAKLAQLLEVHPNTLFNWLRRKDVQEAIADIQETTHGLVANQLKALTMKATNRLSELMDSPVDGVALQAVKDILDRSGHKTKSEIKIDKTVRTFEEKLQNVIEDTIDAEYEMVDEEEEK